MTAVIRYPVLELIVNNRYGGLNMATHEHMVEVREYYENLGYQIRIERDIIDYEEFEDANYPVAVSIES